MPLSAADKLLADRIESDFDYHPPNEEQVLQHQKIRSMAKSLALLITALCPDRRERSLALTKLEEAVMWANAGIARHPSYPPA
jgi:hypothetical protein